MVKGRQTKQKESKEKDYPSQQDSEEEGHEEVKGKSTR